MIRDGQARKVTFNKVERATGRAGMTGRVAMSRYAVCCAWH